MMRRDIDISDLPKPVVDAIEAIIKAHRDQVAKQSDQSARQPRRVGWTQGLLPELPDSFFEPLPSDVLDEFEGNRATAMRLTPPSSSP